MMNLLLFIKHRLGIIWRVAEFFNGFVFKLLYRNKILESIDVACKQASTAQYDLRMLQRDDLTELSDFFKSQPSESYMYFKPHGVELHDLIQNYKNPAFIMYGVFDKSNGGVICGYFMTRFFANKKCFVGFLVDAASRGKGIAGLMGKTMLTICWNNNFEALATVSRKNDAALRAYRKLNDFKILKELPNDYIYIRYERK